MLLLGPLFWLLYYIYSQPVLILTWPLQHPGAFVLLIAVYPVLEELVFRGLIQEGISRYFSQRWGVLSLANLLTSILFAIAHVLYHGVLWALLVVFPSLIFGYSKERYRHLIAPSILHLWYNLGFFWLFRPM